ncbi:DNA-binding MarR family transcriptional regulator [Streptomyces achromogenes]|uniref:MarR family winged helix-turn-helix transcriptional regulator n=1 Tax=Streptomyces achromogenes TaxID=67255 RepID=UPI00278B8082|nr:DNA-binding MarR family transcriptional regulator [Streptomyces achromogenes]
MGVPAGTTGIAEPASSSSGRPPPSASSTLLSDYLDQQLRRDAAMTHADYSLLARLSVAPDRALGKSLLAEQLKFTRSRLTRAVIRLEESDYVRRREDPADGRGQLAELTEAGMELMAKAAPGHATAVRRVVFDALSPEQVEQLATITATVLASLKQADEEDSYPSALPWHRR